MGPGVQNWQRINRAADLNRGGIREDNGYKTKEKFEDATETIKEGVWAPSFQKTHGGGPEAPVRIHKIGQEGWL